MLIEIHAIQNHSPANLNRDDLGAPKTCYFGGVMRSRISSQCIKRSIRMSKEFSGLLGGVRTRQLARLISEKVSDDPKVRKRVEKILDDSGIKQKKSKSKDPKSDDDEGSKMLVYTTQEAIEEMAGLIRKNGEKTDDELAQDFRRLMASKTAVPDMALTGRMLEPDKSAGKLWKKLDTTVEASLQVAHAISTHAALPEVDYFVAADDIPGEDAGAGYLNEALYSSACFYKYFSINWEALVRNLDGFEGNKEHLAAHTVGAFIHAAAKTNPTGKQNSFAAHNPPDGMLIEIKDSPVSYANAFADPVEKGKRSIVEQSIAQLGQYVHDLEIGFGTPTERFWFSPNLRYRLTVVEEEKEREFSNNNHKSLEELIKATVTSLNCDWEEVKKVFINREIAS